MWPGWPGKFGQRGWWIFGLAPTPPWRISSEHNKAPAVDARSGFQVECGVGHDQKCKEEGRVDGATRRAFAIGRLVLATSMPQTGIEALYRRSSPSNRRPVTRSTRHCHAGGRRPGRTRSRREHHLLPDGTRRCLSGGGGGLAQPADSRLAVVDHAGCRNLARISGRGRHLARAISGRLQLPPAPFEAGGVDAGASPFQPYAAAQAAWKYDRCLRPASMRLSPLCAGPRRQNDAPINLQGIHPSEPKRCSKRPSCSTGLQFSSNGGPHYPCRGLPGLDRDRRFPT